MRATLAAGDRVEAMKILYIEDNAANARLVAKYLGLKNDIALLEAATAEEGLVLARAERPDLILMDLNLPRMSGSDALRALRADSDTQDIVVVAVSADAVPDNIRAAMANGFNDYLTKPLDFRRFDRIIDRYRPA
ncbi:MAG: response regulator [Gammaproteobacteria bacterium]|nr:response regulator [Gammaproteobacteria bacterium]